ncbi:Cytochrome P450 [Niveomyces insectorum RCEF 264]|uniref:Cytochrome P450 n=1 Tax=Niveomyces insectorum RCEF 264 TaxID=1081102 RepID=A0A167SN28_9HYPO|nr:Cytochrome P450 [Niveomyces insectorum RCEF 264]
MASLWLTAVVGAAVWWFVSSAVRFAANYRDARRLGLPIVLSPINPLNLAFVVLNAPLRPFLERVIPTAVYEQLKILFYGWEFRDKHGVHDRIGPVFVMVTPNVNEIWCADPAMAQAILARRKDFVLLPEAKWIMRLFGENMISSDGDTWARQRRLIAPNLNERVSEIVWKESLAQAGHMADYVLAAPGGVARDAISSLRAIAINVLGQAGYGQPQTFRPMQLPRHPDVAMTYVDAISVVVELLAAAAFVPLWLLKLSIMPVALQTLGSAIVQLPGLTKDMLDQERRRAAAAAAAAAGGGGGSGGDGRRDNIMSMLVRLSDQAKGVATTAATDGDTPAAHANQILFEDEIAGNMFLVTAAGFDTTANTLSYAFTLTAAYPDIQAWIQEELDGVFGPPGTADGHDPNYVAAFPKLVRCLALMYETLRLFPPLLHISRSISSPQTIATGGKSYDLIKNCAVHINVACLHTSPTVWGADADEFRPQRWITQQPPQLPTSSASSSSSSPPPPPREATITPARGTFVPWSGGPRSCPGQKMSQVEFVAAVATLFWRCRVQPVCRDGETLAHARRRLVGLTQDSQPRLTLQMKRPDEVEVQFIRR